MNLQASADSQNFSDYYTTSGTQVVIKLAPDRYIGIVASDLFPARAVQFVLNQAESADRIFELIYGTP